MQIISIDEAVQFASPFLGKVVSRVRRGHGSAIFLEIGELDDNKKGELTVMIEWSWRVEDERQIAFGSWSDESEFTKRLLDLAA